MGYYLDLEKISIDDYREKLMTRYLPPSRVMLRDKLEERFDCFKEIGIQNVRQMVQLLKKKDKYAELNKIDCLSGDYLKILLRELNSILPKPNKLADFTEISEDTIARLRDTGITNTVKLYDKVLTNEDREELAKSTGISYSEILKLTKLTDLSRIKWVGITYAQVLYNIDLDTVAKVAQADPEDLHVRINQWMHEHNIYKGSIGLNDIRILVETAAELPFEIK